MRVDFPASCDVRFGYTNERVEWYLLAAFFTILNGHGPDQIILRTPPGFYTDFASVPRWPLVYLQYANRVYLPAIPHDDLYKRGGKEEDREFADEVFYWGMMHSLVLIPKPIITEADANAMYAAVRIGGRSHFNYL